MFFEKVGKVNDFFLRDKIWCDFYVKKCLVLLNDVDKQIDLLKCL